MQDGYNRTIDYMRVALTDRCNLKCWYCVGRDEHRCLDPEQMLSYDEFTRILRIAVQQLGIVKIRLTGGEPLLYKRLEEMIVFLRSMEQLRELTLTTNAILLKEKAPMLRRAGLHRVNVSLESASDDIYRRITGKACLNQVLAGLEALRNVGFDKPKLNVVLCRSFKQDELKRLLEIAHDYAHELRFIELMGHDKCDFFSVDDIAREYGAFARLQPLPGRGTATHRYSVTGYDVVLGLIPSRTQPFCKSCRRIRLASDGQLRTCLFSREGIGLRPLLRNGCSDIKLADAFREAVLNKPECAVGNELKMCRVGG